MLSTILSLRCSTLASIWLGGSRNSNFFQKIFLLLVFYQAKLVEKSSDKGAKNLYQC